MNCRLLIALLLIGFNAHAQLDSIKYYLHREQVDSNKIYLLGALSHTYGNTNPDSSLWYAKQQQLLIAKNRGKLPEYFSVMGLYTMGWALWRVGNYPESKAVFLKQLRLSEALNNQRGLIWSYRGIGVIYRNEGNYAQAISNFYKSNSFITNPKNDEDYINNIVDIGKAYEQLNKLDSALKYTQQAYEALPTAIGMYNNGGVYTNLGSIFSKKGNNELAMKWFKLGIDTALKVNDVRNIARTFYEMAAHFKRLHQTDSAISYATKAVALNQQHGFLIQLLASSQMLTELYSLIKKVDSAFKYQTISIAAQNQLFNRENINRLQMLDFNEQLRQKELEAAREKAHEESIHNLQLLGIALFIITFFMAFLVLSKKKVNLRLVEFMGLLALLLAFEFVALLIHPVIQHVTNDSPIMMLLILVLVAAVLVPLHHSLEKWVRKRLTPKPHHKIETGK